MARRIASDVQEAMATARFIRMSPTKARQMVDLIRGRHVDDARRVLRFTAKSATSSVGKVLESAIANAEHNRGLPADELVVVRTWVDEGPTLRRYRPRALGRATRINKRTCHISVVVGRPEDLDELIGAPARAKTTRRARRDAATASGTAAAASEVSKPAPEAEAGAETSGETTAKKTTAKKSTAKKTTAKKTTAKKTTAKKSTAKKTTAKKTTPKKPDEEEH